MAALLACSDESGAGDTSSSSASSSSTGTSGSGGGVDVSGGVIYHSMNKLASTQSGNTPEYSGLNIELVSQGALDSASGTLASQPFDSAACGSAGTCAFSFSGVDVSGASTSLLARLVDTRSEPLWLTTETLSADQAQLTSLQQDGGSLSDARGFAVSREAVDLIVSNISGVSGEDLLARGFVFGLLYSGVSADGSGEPVIGATVTPSSTDFTVVYPNNNFSGSAAATASQGAFIAIPASSADPRDVSFSVTPPAEHAALEWNEAQPALVRSGAVYFLRMYPK